MLLRVSSSQQLEADGDLSLQRQLVMDYVSEHEDWELDEKEYFGAIFSLQFYLFHTFTPTHAVFLSYFGEAWHIQNAGNVLLLDYVSEHEDWELDEKEYFEGSRSGYKTAVSRRHVLQEALEDARKREYDILAAYKDDRIGRRMWEIGGGIPDPHSRVRTALLGISVPECKHHLSHNVIILRRDTAVLDRMDGGKCRRRDSGSWIRAEVSDGDIRIIDGDLWERTQEKRRRRAGKFRKAQGETGVVGRNGTFRDCSSLSRHLCAAAERLSSPRQCPRYPSMYSNTISSSHRAWNRAVSL